MYRREEVQADRRARSRVWSVGLVLALLAATLGLASTPAGADTAGGSTPAARANAATIDAGGNHVCMIRTGEVWCWGANNAGRLGDGTTDDRSTPSQTIGINDAVAVSAGGFHTCALLGDGTVECWGANSQGQLGNCLLYTSDAADE